MRIGPYIYPGLRNEADKRMYGFIDYPTCEISLDESSSPQVLEVTLWHEIIHAILYNAGITKHKEKLVDIIAAGITQVLQDNPRLAAPPTDEHSGYEAPDPFIKKHPDIAVIK